MATLITPDGIERPIAQPLTLAAMQDLVGGFIEMVTIGGQPNRREVLIVNDEGVLQRLEPNAIATGLYRGDPPRHTGVIVGNAIRCIVRHE